MQAVQAQIMAQIQWRSTCCNPFNINGHTGKKSAVSSWMCEKYPQIKPGCRICGSCRMKLAKASQDLDVDKDSDSDSSADSPTDVTVLEEDHDSL